MNRFNLHSLLIPSTKKRSNLILILFVLLPLLSAAQSEKKNLETKFSKLQSEIKDAEALLNQTKKKKESSLSELKLLNRKIDVRQQVISNISQQVGLINSDMRKTRDLISSMEKDLGGLREQYAKMIYYTYVNEEEYKPLHFMFSSKSINDAFQRIQYVKTLHAFRKDQITAIKSIQKKLEEKLLAIEKSRHDKESLLAKEQEEKNKLDNEKSQKDKTLKGLQAEEKDLKKQIDRKKKDVKDLNNKIEAVIAEEIRKEKEKAAAIATAEAAKKKEAEKKEAEKKEAEKNLAETKPATASETKATTVTETKPATTAEKKAEPVKKVNMGLTPEMQMISKNFAGNKGRLPWPVERGTVTEKFGKHPHPVLKDIIIENNGIDISTSEGAYVRSIFEGEVINVIYNPSFQKGVIIKHGEYYSVYTNLSSVTVKAGDKIKTKQYIGIAWEDPDEGKTDVHLEIWKGTVILDPSLWVSKQ